MNDILKLLKEYEGGRYDYVELVILSSGKWRLHDCQSWRLVEEGNTLKELESFLVEQIKSY